MRRAVDRLTMEELALAGETDPHPWAIWKRCQDVNRQKEQLDSSRWCGSRGPEPRG